MPRSYSKSASSSGQHRNSGYIAQGKVAAAATGQDVDLAAFHQHDLSQLKESYDVAAGSASLRRRTVRVTEEQRRPLPPLNIMGLQSSHDELREASHNLKVVAGVDKLTLLIYSSGDTLIGEDDECPQGRVGVYQNLLDAREKNEAGDGYVAGVPMIGRTVYPENGYKICQRFFCPVSFRTSGCRVAVGRPEWSRTIPAAQIIIDATSLTLYGHDSMIAEVNSILRSLGIRVDRLHVSLLHVCFDLLDVRTSPLVELLDGGYLRSRYKWQTHTVYGPTEKRHGLACGSSSECRLNLYDKLHLLREQLENASLKQEEEIEAKYAALVERWGYEPEHVCRIEKQMSGGWLRRRFADCDTVENVFRRLGAICRVMLTDQLELLDGLPDAENKHKSRVEVHPFWSALVASVDTMQWHAEPVDVVKVKREVRAKSMSNLVDDQRRLIVRNLALNPIFVDGGDLSVIDLVEHQAALTWEAIRAHPQGIVDDAIKLRALWEQQGVLPVLDVPPTAAGSGTNWKIEATPLGIPRSEINSLRPLGMPAGDDLPF